MAGTATWLGQEFRVYQHSDRRSENWSEAPGLYIFAGIGSGGWVPLYVGKTESLLSGFPLTKVGRRHSV